MDDLVHASGAERLWHTIQARLDHARPSWTQEIEHFGQVAAAERREAGAHWTDDEVFEALLRAILSNNIDWAKIERVLPELREVFSDFSLNRFSEATADEVERRLVPWFTARRAGSMTLKGSLTSLVRATKLLRQWSEVHGSAEDYFLEVISWCDDDPKEAAVALGAAGSPRKLPALGIALAAESLRNMGFDICKPDRHLCRAVGSFGLVAFHNWKDPTDRRPPTASTAELRQTMIAVDRLARDIGVRPILLDNAIWLICAQMGLQLSNAELAALARQSGLRT